MLLRPWEAKLYSTLFQENLIKSPPLNSFLAQDLSYLDSYRGFNPIFMLIISIFLEGRFRMEVF
jgi:hypothetical protein